MIEQKDLLLVPFPFSDQSGRKVRPVIVISNNSFNEHSEDIITIGVTSNISKTRYSLKFDNKDLENGKLITPCTIKCENILKIDKNIVIKKIGRIKNEKTNEIIKIINQIIKVS